MKLVHVTAQKNLKNIQNKGLIAGYKSAKVTTTTWLTTALHVCKPADAFRGLDIRKCIWFAPEDTGYRLVTDKNTMNLIVNSEDLDKNKLFYIDGEIADEIKNSYNKSPEEILRIGIEYWQHLKPFSEYIMLHRGKEEMSRYIDVVYFDDVAPEGIEVYLEQEEL